MPSIIFNFKITSVGSSAIVQNGDTVVLNPSSTSKSYGGSNSFVVGDTFGSTFVANAPSATITNDPDLIDGSSV